MVKQQKKRGKIDWRKLSDEDLDLALATLAHTCLAAGINPMPLHEAARRIKAYQTLEEVRIKLDELSTVVTEIAAQYKGSKND